MVIKVGAISNEMKTEQLFRDYEYLVDEAEAAFHRVALEHGSCIKCDLHCSDCCHAVFGLFLIEAAYLREHFEQMKDKAMQEALDRCERADKEMEKLQKMLETFADDPQMQHYTLAKERVRCPLLDDQDECVLYHRRPITCRLYGIPTRIQGKARVCGKSGFKQGEKYPIFDLDAMYHKLYVLSNELVEAAGQEDMEKASLLISVAKAVQTPVNELIEKIFESSGEDKGRGRQGSVESEQTPGEHPSGTNQDGGETFS
jgi:Fe-S-cluster containining protein